MYSYNSRSSDAGKQVSNPELLDRLTRVRVTKFKPHNKYVALSTQSIGVGTAGTVNMVARVSLVECV